MFTTVRVGAQELRSIGSFGTKRAALTLGRAHLEVLVRLVPMDPVDELLACRVAGRIERRKRDRHEQALSIVPSELAGMLGLRRRPMARDAEQCTEDRGGV